MSVERHDSWLDHAACAGLNPRMFFPEPGQSVKEALAVCASCPVKAECLEYALTNGERFGIYGWEYCGSCQRGFEPAETS